MNSRDSVTKIITQYFAAVTKVPIHFHPKGARSEIVVEPRRLRVSPTIFQRRMTCVAHCGGCCAKLTCDYLPPELSRYHGSQWRSAEGEIARFTVRHVYVNGKLYPIYSELQKGNDGHFCKFLRQEDGRCNIHGHHPFSCDFELLRFSLFSDPNRANQLSHRPFGRGWNMLTVEGTRGAKCEWYELECDEEWKGEVIRKMARLQEWCDYFEIPSVVPEVIEWVQSGPHKEPLFIGGRNE